MTNNARPALTEEQRNHAVELLRKHRGTREVARLVGCSPASVTRIRQRTEDVPPACYTPHHAIVSREAAAQERLRRTLEIGVTVAEEMLPYVRNPRAFREWAVGTAKLVNATRAVNGPDQAPSDVSVEEARDRLRRRLKALMPEDDP